MKVKEIRASYGETVNTGNFENIKVGTEIVIETDDNQKIFEIVEHAHQFVKNETKKRIKKYTDEL